MDPQTLLESGTAAPIAAPALPSRRAARRGRPTRRASLLAFALVVLLIAGGLLAGRQADLAQQDSLPRPPSLRAQTGFIAPANGMPGAAGATAKAPASAAADVPASMSGAAGTAGGAKSSWDPKIIRTATLDLMVADVEGGLATVRDIAAGAQGAVFSSNSQYQGDSQVATVTIQVPSENFDGVMTRLRKVGVKVLGENTTSQDVTEEYTDLSSQLKNWQAQEDQLRLLMSHATTVGDTLAVEHELSQVNGQIEQAQGRLNYLSHRSALSTITISLQPKPLVAPPAPRLAWQPVDTAARAWAASLALLSQAADAVILIAVFCWWLVPLGLLGLLLLRTLRRPGLVS